MTAAEWYAVELADMAEPVAPATCRVCADLDPDLDPGPEGVELLGFCATCRELLAAVYTLAREGDHPDRPRPPSVREWLAALDADRLRRLAVLAIDQAELADEGWAAERHARAWCSSTHGEPPPGRPRRRRIT